MKASISKQVGAVAMTLLLVAVGVTGLILLPKEANASIPTLDVELSGFYSPTSDPHDAIMGEYIYFDARDSSDGHGGGYENLDFHWYFQFRFPFTGYWYGGFNVSGYEIYNESSQGGFVCSATDDSVIWMRKYISPEYEWNVLVRAENTYGEWSTLMNISLGNAYFLDNESQKSAFAWGNHDCDMDKDGDVDYNDFYMCCYDWNAVDKYCTYKDKGSTLSFPSETPTYTGDCYPDNELDILRDDDPLYILGQL